MLVLFLSGIDYMAKNAFGRNAFNTNSAGIASGMSSSTLYDHIIIKQKINVFAFITQGMVEPQEKH